MFPLLALLAIFGMTVASVAGRTRPGPEPAGKRDACDVSILLIEADGDHALSQAVDRLSGGLGFSHVALDACEVDEDGTPLAIDCRPGYGVCRRPLAQVAGGRRVVRVHLPISIGAEVYGCARGRVGLAWDAFALLFGPEHPSRGLVCSELVFECLPLELQRRVTLPKGRPVAPNDLAAAFGIRSPDSPDVHL